MSAGRIVRNIFLSLIILALLAVAGVYIYGMVYFKDHFFMHTTINGFDASQMTVEEAESRIAAVIAGYSLEIDEYRDHYCRPDGLSLCIQGRGTGI